jgi:hypothetical protein
MNNSIIGTWEIDPGDVKSLKLYGNIAVEFKSNGELVYNTYSEGKVQKTFLVYKIKENLIITDQPSSPKLEETEFRILSNGKLQLYFNQEESTFIKAS